MIGNTHPVFQLQYNDKGERKKERERNYKFTPSNANKI